MMSSDLVVFTTGFPYAGGESILSTELAALAERFDRIHIVPSRHGTGAQALPANVCLHRFPWTSTHTRRRKVQALASSSPLAVALTTARRRADWAPYLRNSRAYLDILSRAQLRAQDLTKWVAQHHLTEALFYDYWFENMALELALMRRAGTIRCAVARAHSFDVFDERWPELGRVPFRQFKADHLDAIFAVSNLAANYMREKLERNQDKVCIARLGAPLPEMPIGDTPAAPIVMSCSALRPLKHVHRIPGILRSMKRPVSWVHFGDGTERARVEDAATRLPPEVSWTLRGDVDKAEILEFYRQHEVTAFLSTSQAEGIPLSMMEAQSFGIPVIALNVGAIGELVTDETGILLPSLAPDDEMAAALNLVIERRFDRETIRARFARSFDASHNYHSFGDDLIRVFRETQRRDG